MAEVVYEDAPVKDTTNENADLVQHFKEIYVGAGANRLICNKEGFGIGAETYEDCPFKVSWDGVVTAVAGNFIDANITGILTGATIKNAAGDIVIDATGLNSAANFQKATVSSGSTHTTSSSSYQDVPGSTLNDFVLERDTVVIISVFLRGWNTTYFDSDAQDAYDNTHKGLFQLVDSIDGVLANQAFTGIPYLILDSFGSFDSVGLADQIVTQTQVFLLSAGTHSMKLQYKSASGNGDTVINAFIVSYTILGV